MPRPQWLRGRALEQFVDRIAEARPTQSLQREDALIRDGDRSRIRRGVRARFVGCAAFACVSDDAASDRTEAVQPLECTHVRRGRLHGARATRALASGMAARRAVERSDHGDARQPLHERTHVGFGIRAPHDMIL